MDKKSIHLSDLHRILFGDAPAIYIVEVFIRTLCTYFILLVVIRWLSKRMRGQVTILEMAFMLTLGAIVSTVMQVPECGILMAVLVLLCTLTFEWGLSWLEFKSTRVERITQGELTILVKHGVIQPKEMAAVRIFNPRLLADLRGKGIYNLGIIKRVYLEASGMFTIYKAKEQQPGLSTLPSEDPEIHRKCQPTDLFSCSFAAWSNRRTTVRRVRIAKTKNGRRRSLLRQPDMKSEDIHLSDWHRILLGQVPAEFYVELIIRALVVYVILLVLIRAMGKRMFSQLSRNELAALVSLTAAIGVPLMASNRGLLPAIVVAMVFVSIQRFIASRATKSRAFEQISQGRPGIVIKDRVVDMKALSAIGLSRSQLFPKLRRQNITHFGMVERFYMEPNGTFTLIKNDEPKPGLLILPETYPEFRDEFAKADSQKVCANCGLDQNLNKSCCPNCGHREWVEAVS